MEHSPSSWTRERKIILNNFYEFCSPPFLIYYINILHSVKKIQTFRILPATSNFPFPRAFSLGIIIKPWRPRRSPFGSHLSSAQQNSPRTVMYRCCLSEPLPLRVHVSLGQHSQRPQKVRAELCTRKLVDLLLCDFQPNGSSCNPKICWIHAF